MAHTRTPPDPFGARSNELDSPSRFSFEITPGASDLTFVTRGVYVGTSGNVFCRPSGHANNLPSYLGGTHANFFFMNTVAGTILPLRLDKVWVRNESDTSQNTTATHLVGLY